MGFSRFDRSPAVRRPFLPSKDLPASLGQAPRFDDPWDRVSRHVSALSSTFAMAIRVLPPRVRNDIGLGYLYFRMVDVVEDDVTLDSQGKRKALARIGALFESPMAARVWAEGLLPFVKKTAHRRVFEDAPTLCALAAGQSPRVKRALWTNVETMALGMGEFLAGSSGPLRIGTWAEYERYVHICSGVVGEFLNAVFLDGSLRGPAIERGLRVYGPSVARILKATNDLQDVYGDADERGTVLLPEELCKIHGFTHEDLLGGRAEGPVNQGLQAFASWVWGQFPDAERYLALFPKSQLRERYFLAVPLLMAAETLRQWPARSKMAFRTRGSLAPSRARKLLVLTWAGPLAAISNHAFHWYSRSPRAPRGEWGQVAGERGTPMTESHAVE